MVIRAIPKGKASRKTLQTIGGHSYAIPDIGKENATLFSYTAGTIGGIILLPIILPVVTIVTFCMAYGHKSVRSAILKFLIPNAMKPLADKFKNHRQLLLQHVRGRVLDVGAGGGGYFPLLQNVAHVVAVEPVASLKDVIRKTAMENGLDEHQLTVVTETLEDYADTAPPNSFDWVVLGNVLCEVPDPQSCLDAVHKLLKPGGMLYFCEHQGCPRGTRTRTFQDVVNPWWSTFSGGCNCNRETLRAIEGMAGWDVVSWDFENVKVMGGPMVMGLAQKAVISV